MHTQKGQVKMAGVPFPDFFEAVCHFACPKATPEQIRLLRKVENDYATNPEHLMVMAVLVGLAGPHRKSVEVSDKKLAKEVRKLARKLLLVHPDNVGGHA